MIIGSDVYRKASGDHNPREIMEEYSSKPSASDRGMFATGKLTQDFTKTDPFTMEQKQGFVSSLIDGNTQKRTVLQTTRPKKSYGVDNVNIAAMKRSDNSTANGGSQLKGQVATAKADVKGQMSEIRKDIKQAQCEAVDAVKCAAKADPEISPDVAVKTFAPPNEATKLTASLAMAGAALGSAGTVATVILSKKEQETLSIDQQEALLDDTLARLQSSGTNETTMDANSAATVKLDVPKQSEIAWHDMDTDDLRCLLEADVDKLPEMIELDNTRIALDKVQDNHGYLDNRQDNDFMDELPEIDAGSVELVGMSLQEFQMTKGVTAENDPYFAPANVTDISSKFEKRQPEDDILAYQPPQKILDQMLGA